MKQKNIQILLADPEHECPNTLQVQLQQSGYNVTVTDTGADVALQCDLEPPNVLILDTQLPDMDAFDLCESIRRDSSDTNMIVIILADVCDEINQTQLEQRVEYVGADCFVTRPYRHEQIVQLINEFTQDMEEEPRIKSSAFPTRVSWPTSLGS